MSIRERINQALERAEYATVFELADQTILANSTQYNTLKQKFIGGFVDHMFNTQLRMCINTLPAPEPAYRNNVTGNNNVSIKNISGSSINININSSSDIPENSKVLDLLIEKLNTYRISLATAYSTDQKFSLRKQIEQTEKEIEEERNRTSNPKQTNTTQQTNTIMPTSRVGRIQRQPTTTFGYAKPLRNTLAASIKAEDSSTDEVAIQLIRSVETKLNPEADEALKLKIFKVTISDLTDRLNKETNEKKANLLYDELFEQAEELVEFFDSIDSAISTSKDVTSKKKLKSLVVSLNDMEQTHQTKQYIQLVNRALASISNTESASIEVAEKAKTGIAKTIKVVEEYLGTSDLDSIEF